MFDKSVWDNAVLSKRIFYLLTNLSFFFETAEEKFQKFAQNLNKQCVLLVKNLKKKPKQTNDIFAIKSIILASLCYNNLKSYYNFSIDLLLTFLRNFVRHGMHYLRSPSEHFFALFSC